MTIKVTLQPVEWQSKGEIDKKKVYRQKQKNYEMPLPESTDNQPKIPGIEDAESNRTENETLVVLDAMNTINAPVRPDATKHTPNNKLSDETNMLVIDKTNKPVQDATSNSVEATETQSEDIKPSRGTFKTKTITIRRSRDPRTFKCSMCGTRVVWYSQRVECPIYRQS